jgi:hypothetical protein
LLHFMILDGSNNVWCLSNCIYTFVSDLQEQQLLRCRFMKGYYLENHGHHKGRLLSTKEELSNSCNCWKRQSCLQNWNRPCQAKTLTTFTNVSSTMHNNLVKAVNKFKLHKNQAFREKLTTRIKPIMLRQIVHQ